MPITGEKGWEGGGVKIFIEFRPLQEFMIAYKLKPEIFLFPNPKQLNSIYLIIMWPSLSMTQFFQKKIIFPSHERNYQENKIIITRL